MTRKLISIVSPVYNEEWNIGLFYNELVGRLDLLNDSYDFEIIFVNDWSRDNSYVILQDLANNNQRVKIINFSRNFWQQIALTAWIEYCSWDSCITIDSDMQDPIDAIPSLIKKWEEWFDIVYWKRRSRMDGLITKFTSFLYYRFINAVSSIHIEKDVWDYKLMDKKVIVAIKDVKEKYRFMRWITSYVWFKSFYLLIDRNQRYAWRSSLRFFKRLNEWINSIISLSTIPLSFISTLWFIFGFIWFVWIIVIFYIKFILWTYYVSWVPTMIVIFLFFSWIQLLMLWIIWEYIARIYNETRDRPIYIVSEKINFD